MRRRETGDAGPAWQAARTHGRNRFSGMRVKAAIDMHDAHLAHKLPLLKRRSDITEMILADGLLLALTQTGVCVAFARHQGMRRLCYLNIAEDEIIRSLFHNKANRTIITVSVFRSDNYTSLKCRSTSIDSIEQGRPQDGRPVFDSESLRYPGFIEFDEVNSKVITFSADNRYGHVALLVTVKSGKRLTLDTTQPLHDLGADELHRPARFL